MGDLRAIAIIPARMGSSRFPGKPLAPICGMPMIGHVWHRAMASAAMVEVWVATCDEEIRTYVESIGGRAVMTKDSHERCTDRTEEAVGIIERETEKAVDAVVMVQGDEPMILPDMLDQAVRELRDPAVNVVNLYSELREAAQAADANEVKVVVDLNGDALYFSRSPIPCWTKVGRYGGAFRQVCVIAFRRAFLDVYARLSPSPLEQVESVDMLRILEHGYKIRMSKSDAITYSVDTPDDLSAVERVMAGDALFEQYR